MRVLHFSTWKHYILWQECIKFSHMSALLDKVTNDTLECTGIILGLRVTEELHRRPYMVTKRSCVWNKTFPLGYCMLHLIMFLYQMTTKASNVLHFFHISILGCIIYFGVKQITFYPHSALHCTVKWITFHPPHSTKFWMGNLLHFIGENVNII